MKLYELPESSGIYCLENLLNQKVYVGSSFNISERVGNHIWSLVNNRHINKHLQRAYNKYDGSNFIAYTLELCELRDLLTREQDHFDILLYAQQYIDSDGKDNRFITTSYNLTPTAGRTTGFKHSEEELARMSIRKKTDWSNSKIVDKYYTTRDKQWWEDFKQRNTIRGRYQKEEYISKLSLASLNSESNKRKRKPLLAYNRLTGEFICEYEGIGAASRQLEFNKNNILHVLKGKKKYTHDTVFKYKESDSYPLKIQPVAQYNDLEKRKQVMNNIHKNNEKPVTQHTLDGTQIAEFTSAQDAMRKLGYSNGVGIRNCCAGKLKRYRGFLWKLKNETLSLQQNSLTLI